MIKCEERYNKSKMVHSILRHVAEKTQTPIESLYASIGWPLNRKYGHAVDAFKLSITNPEVWNEVTFENAIIKEELTSYIGRRLTPQPTKVRADVEVTCFGYEGIDAVKIALRAAEASAPASKNAGKEDAPAVEAPPKPADSLDIPLPAFVTEATVKVRLVSPPLYVLTSQCLDKSTGIAMLETAIEAIEKSIRAAGGSCSVRMAPKAVTESDDAELQALMEKRERENAEVSGDEDVSGSDEGDV